ncbi:Histidinol-phosphate aminotransferase [Pseudomonas fluorescens]|jgi:DNA-binding transcriptional MocR family regulator|uniref:Histidinol-phosphate aminotransferase n=1 Tax=Pseudomonas fluorescens TaxID=294 RepID=A0A5E6PAA4_PSEFL|nr:MULTISPECIES: PLP-dependent aminotransferase family protein [Pseudomonas]MBA1195637.1 PLP-dependent aminotransferase family protein [Pseudomonas plecoglossicida]QYX54449.1 PLP-dependent aminotransferase family protein [Pseudomonas sp. S07E 245]VVM38674.1 Histidinol-phosphate aminotransferase [Pseudomonas fluorescens]VVM42404.1 Histidinol-phosphate aminotransferase [Pseudomonas fluorescens]
MLVLHPDSATPLVNQIIDGLRELIDSQALKPGAKVPSIRAFAATYSVSTFTVVEAYDRLVAQGLLVSRGNTGFFVNRAASEQLDRPAHGADNNRPSFNAEWYLQQIFETRQLPFKPGCGWLPNDWMYEDGLRRGMRQVAGSPLELSGYGEPMGLPELRTLTAQNLQQELSIVVNPAQLMLTHGASQALDLAVRTLVRPGDVVLVDDPGYPNLMSILRFQGATLIGVPRTPAGYDLDRLEQLLSEHRPSVFFTQPHLHSPTCSRTPLPQLHRLLQLASQHGFRLVENNLYADMIAEPQPCLASLDHLQQVVYVGSYSKSISPNVRVGYLFANPELMQQLLRLKMRSGLTTSQVMERVVYAAIIDGRWRKHLKRLRQRLAEAHQEVGRHLHRLGFELFTESDEGMYVWARHRAIPDSAALLDDALEQGIMLGPGQLFMVDAQATGWMRFNVAFSTDPAMWELLEKILVKQVRRSAI